MVESRGLSEHWEPKPDIPPELIQKKAEAEFELLKLQLKKSGYPLEKISNMMNQTKLFMMRNDLRDWAMKFERGNGDSNLGIEFIQGYVDQINNRLVEFEQ
ncbi:MAG: hypothetical protein AAB815_01410 [Patescibacteria group bacterium]